MHEMEGWSGGAWVATFWRKLGWWLAVTNFIEGVWNILKHICRFCSHYYLVFIYLVFLFFCLGQKCKHMLIKVWWNMVTGTRKCLMAAWAKRSLASAGTNGFASSIVLFAGKALMVRQFGRRWSNSFMFFPYHIFSLGDRFNEISNQDSFMRGTRSHLCAACSPLY